ncbi:galactose mutarotase-like [Amphiura filiformis]|uniref:galactose mutarotase-like n=1 Tax=Amphiura filiformis TaxID=82378 RepID=UPI003B21F44C
MPVTAADFGQTSDGRSVVEYTLTNDNGMVVKVISYGASISSLQVPNKDGKLDDVVLGFDNIAGYEKDSMYLGRVVGRCCNRICNGRFKLDGQDIQLPNNDGPNHLHGGLNGGFSKVVWSGSLDGDIVKLTHTSPDGDNGYPGEVTATVTYQLTNDNAVVINYTATTTKATPVNLTNHSYFNLAGHNGGTIYDHEIQIAANNYTPKKEGEFIVSGKIAPVHGTVYDLREPVAIGQRVHDVEQGGYDHNYCLDQPSLEQPSMRVHHPGSGRTLAVFTTKPGVHLYTSNFLDGTQVGKNGTSYPKHGAFCLETQYYPDSVNHDNFPNCILRPGDTYQHTTCFKFNW